MNIWVVLIALGLNISLGRIFRPYSGVIVNLSVEFSKRTARLTHKKIVRLSTAALIVFSVLIWAAVDCAILFLQYNSKIYAYICNTVAIFLCIGCGQFSAIMSKMAKNTENDVYVKQLLGFLLVDKANALERKQYKKVLGAVTVRYVAERIVAPAIIMLVLGAGALVTYTFINTVAYSDKNDDVQTHGFANAAIKISSFFSWCGYALLTLFLWALKWVCGIKRSFGNVKDIAQRCHEQLKCFDDNEDFGARTVKRMNAIMLVITVMTLVFVVAVYIFTQAVFATLGLDEYWDFWNGENLGGNIE